MVCVSRLAESGVCVTWYDNFSKMYHLNTPSFRKGEYASALWTGFGHHLPWTDIPDALKFQTQVDGEHLDAMPANLFDDATIKGVCRWLKKFNPPHSNPTLYDESVCNVLGIRSVPVKIRPASCPNPHDPLLSTYNQRAISLDTFVPGGIPEWNIGSNTGLAMMLKKELDKVKVNGVHNPTKYRMIFADVNIFERLMKVCICRSSYQY
jgi:hypothetical protein